MISKIKKNAGPPTAKTCRAVISGIFKLAVRYGAISINPVREVESIEHPAKKPARAIQTEEIALLRKHLVGDEAAVRADLPDLVAFMLGTGIRIGESLAVLWSQIEIQKYLFKVGPVDLVDWSLLTGLVDFFEEGVAAGKGVLELIGNDVSTGPVTSRYGECNTFSGTEMPLSLHSTSWASEASSSVLTVTAVSKVGRVARA